MYVGPGILRSRSMSLFFDEIFNELADFGSEPAVVFACAKK
jgi:hypothetical protein